MPPFHIRRATPQDASLVRQLTRAAYAKWVPILGREPLPMVADYDRAVRDHHIDLLYDGGELVALIECIPHPDHLFIENLAIAPGHQGRGLGRLLLTHAQCAAQTAGLAQLRLLTNQAMTGNVRFYLSAGFTLDRTEPFRGGTTVYMSQPVAPP